MWWVRFLCLTVPAALVAGLVWLWGLAGQLSIETPEDLVIAVRQDPGSLNPMVASSGTTREITDLVFERLFRRDDEMLMRGHLAERWELRQRLEFFFRDEAGAAAALTSLEALREIKDERWRLWGIVEMEVDGSSLRLELDHHRIKAPEEIEVAFDAESRIKVTRIQLEVKDSARESFDLFRGDAVERGQIRHVEFSEDNRSAVISAAGEVDLFQRELELFYEANANLQPVLEPLGEVGYVAQPEVRLFLREGVQWHDGTVFSAADVVFSYREVARPGSESALKPWFSAVNAVDVVGPLEVRVVLLEPYAPLMESWEALPILPAHLLAEGDGLAPAQRKAFFFQPVGTGPYRVVSREPGRSLTMEAFGKYFRGEPLQQRMIYRVLETDSTRAMGLRLGQVDVLRPGELEREVLRKNQRVEEVDGVPRKQSFVAWNLRREPLIDARVRRALAHIVDVREVIEQAVGQESRPCRGIFYPGLWVCPEEVSLPDFDKEEAYALLEAAGWKADRSKGSADEDGEGTGAWLKNQAGETLGFRLLVDAGNLEHREVAEKLVEGWRQAGVRAELVAMPWSAMISESLVPRDFDAMLLTWELGFRRDQSELWHSSQAEVDGGNFTGLRNQITDDLLSRLQVETDAKKVQELAVELQDLLWTLQPCMFLHESGEVVMMRRGVVREMRPMMDGRRSDSQVQVPAAGLIASRPWWVKKSQKHVDAGATETEAQP